MKRKKKIAIYGGAFNPITTGHIQVAQFVLNSNFDEVWLMPAYKHMYNKSMESTEDRLNMCKLVTQIYDRIKVFDYEIRNKLSGETFKLVKKLKNDPDYKDYNFSFIIGQDNANTFNKWSNYEQLEKICSFVVIPRKGVDINKNVDWYLNKPHIYLNKENDIIDVSSTLVRNLLNKKINDDELKKYIDSNVLDYIKNKKLYD